MYSYFKRSRAEAGGEFCPDEALQKKRLFAIFSSLLAVSSEWERRVTTLGLKKVFEEGVRSACCSCDCLKKLRGKCLCLGMSTVSSVSIQSADDLLKDSTICRTYYRDHR